MKIHDLELFLVSVRQHDSPMPLQSLLVRLVTTMGIEGWGESGHSWRVGELAERRDSLLAVLEGWSIYDIEELHSLDVLASASLRCAVEMALWDALARTLQQPLCNLLGGVYRQKVPVSIRIGGRQPNQIGSIARELADQGFHTQMITATGQPEDDLETVAVIREMAGDRVELRLDGMLRYDLETARDLAADLEAYDLQFFLDPLDTQQLQPVASLGRQTSVPLGVWRSIHSPAHTFQAAKYGAASYCMIDLEQVGGIIPARACAAVAASAGMMPVLGGRPSVGIASAAMLHLAAATASFSASNELTSRQLRDTMLVEPLKVVDGMVGVPHAFGLGVVVDRAKVERQQAN
jgi:muconate cycloisomerase